MDTIQSENVMLTIIASTMAYGLWKLIKLYSSAKRDEHFVRHSKIYSLSELKKDLSFSKPDPKRKFLVKVKVAEKERYIEKRSAYLNEILFCYPDKDDLASSLTWKFNKDKEQWIAQDH